MRIPHPDNPRITTNEQVAAILLPRGDDTRAAPHPQDLVQPTERADHLHRVAAHGRVVVPVQTHDPISWRAGTRHRDCSFSGRQVVPICGISKGCMKVRPESVPCATETGIVHNGVPAAVRMMPPTSWLIMCSEVMLVPCGFPLKNCEIRFRWSQSYTLNGRSGRQQRGKHVLRMGASRSYLIESCSLVTTRCGSYAWNASCAGKPLVEIVETGLSHLHRSARSKSAGERAFQASAVN